VWAPPPPPPPPGGREGHETTTGKEGGISMKEQRVRCPACGLRFTVIRFERERTPLYCAPCREERQRDQTRERMRTLRERRRRG